MSLYGSDWSWLLGGRAIHSFGVDNRAKVHVCDLVPNLRPSASFPNLQAQINQSHTRTAVHLISRQFLVVFTVFSSLAALTPGTGRKRVVKTKDWARRQSSGRTGSQMAERLVFEVAYSYREIETDSRDDGTMSSEV